MDAVQHVLWFVNCRQYNRCSRQDNKMLVGWGGCSGRRLMLCLPKIEFGCFRFQPLLVSRTWPALISTEGLTPVLHEHSEQPTVFIVLEIKDLLWYSAIIYRYELETRSHLSTGTVSMYHALSFWAVPHKAHQSNVPHGLEPSS